MAGFKRCGACPSVRSHHATGAIADFDPAAYQAFEHEAEAQREETLRRYPRECSVVSIHIPTMLDEVDKGGGPGFDLLRRVSLDALPPVAVA